MPTKSAELVAQTFHDEILTRYGGIFRLHTDKGKEFDNQVLDALCSRWGVDKTLTSGYAPWSNGMVERSNRSVKQMLRQACADNPLSWDTHLPKLRMALNTVPHSTTGLTPFKVWFSRCEEAYLPIDMLTGRLPKHLQYECSKGYVNDQSRVCHEIHEMVRQNTGKAAQAQAAGRRRAGLKIRKYKPGDMVWRYYPPNASEKLNSCRWMGPYPVHDVDDTNHTVKLPLPSTGRGGPVSLQWTHTSNVKPVKYTKSGKTFVLLSPDSDYFE